MTDQAAPAPRTALFLIAGEGEVLSFTLLDADGSPVDGFTGCSGAAGLAYLAAHPGTPIDTQTL